MNEPQPTDLSYRADLATSLSWIPPGTSTCAVLPSCEGCALAVLFTLPKPDQVLLPCICHFRSVLPEHFALVVITYFHPAVLSLASYHLPNRNVKPTRQRADGVFDPVFQAVPGASKFPNKTFVQWRSGLPCPRNSDTFIMVQ